MANVCMILEGTYPYITGGVSSWVHDLISNLPDITFDIVAILPSKNYLKEYKYKIPSNVKSIKNIFLNEFSNEAGFNIGYFHRKEFFNILESAVTDIKNNKFDALKTVMDLFGKFRPDSGDLIKSAEGWEFLNKLYERFNPEFSYLDFFWTMRFIMIPLINLMKAEPPECDCIHTISTGYAGILASLFKIRTNKKMMLTEHGIYTNERVLEIVNASWIYERHSDTVDIMKEISPLKKLWINLFMYIGKITYYYSDKIITLYNDNMHLQISLGADPEKCEVIPNGIDVARFKNKRTALPLAPKYKIGYVGRIVQIKDIKTLIYAARFVADKYPEAEFLLKGPTDEEKDYYAECRTLTSILGLEKNVMFLGPSDVSDFYKDLDLLALSSISEAQPLALLEANLCAVPVVATDVGAVSELIFGADSDDRALGASGAVVAVKSPEALGGEIIRLLRDRELNVKMGANGVKRVLKYYKKEELISKYHELYFKYAGLAGGLKRGDGRWRE